MLGLVGSGNNGGDTLIALERLAQSGWNAWACMVRPRPENDPLVQRARDAGCQIRAVDEDLTWLGEQLEQSEVVLDGVLGTGVRLPLKAEIARVLAFVKDYAGMVNVAGSG